MRRSGVWAVTRLFGEADFGDCTFGGEIHGFVHYPSVNGNQMSTAAPLGSALQATPKLTFVVLIRPTTWTPAANRYIAARAIGGNVFRLILLATTGALYLGTFDNAAVETSVNSALYLTQSGVQAGEWLWLAASKDPNEGATARNRLYWSRDGVTWNQFLNTTPATTVINNTSTAPLEIGATNATQTWDGDIAYVSIRNGVGAGGTVGGTEVYRFDGDVDLFGINPAATTFPVTTGQTMTVVRTGGNPLTLVPATQCVLTPLPAGCPQMVPAASGPADRLDLVPCLGGDC